MFCGQITVKYCFIYQEKQSDPNKKIVVAKQPSDDIMLYGVSGALGSRFKSCRPDIL